MDAVPMGDTGQDFESPTSPGFCAYHLNRGKSPGQGKKRLRKVLAGQSAELPPRPEQEQPEHLLVKRTERGDESAFSVLVEQYWEPIRRYVYYLIRDGAVADELTQETFLKAWQALPMHDQKRRMNFRPWLYRVAYTTMVDYQRKTRGLDVLLTEDKGREKLEQASWMENVENRLCKRESISAALQKVYPQYRQCLVLRYIYDYSFQEIAQSLSISEVAVRVNISRGRKQFSEAYVQEGRKSNSVDTSTREEKER